MVTVLMSSASYLGHYEKKINKVFWKYWSPCEPWLTIPTKNQMKLEGLKQNMKGTAFLLYLRQQQADTVIWAPWCLVILDIQLSADLSSTRLGCSEYEIIFSITLLSWLFNHTLPRMISFISYSDIWVRQLFGMGWTGRYSYSRLSRKSENSIYKKIIFKF